MTKEIISSAQLMKILFDVKGARFCTIVTTTEPKMNKKNNPYFGNLLKTSEANVTMNFIYENAVNNQQIREGNEGTFVVKPRTWGEKIPNTCFIMHNDQMYMEVKYNAIPSSSYYSTIETNEIINKEFIKPFLPAKKSQAESQGVEKEIIIRDIKISNIREIKINQKHYIIK